MRRVLSVAVTPDGRRVVSASRDQAIRVWDLKTGKLVASLSVDHSVEAVAITPGGAVIIVGDEGGSSEEPIAVVLVEDDGEATARCVLDLQRRRGEAWLSQWRLRLTAQLRKVDGDWRIFTKIVRDRHLGQRRDVYVREQKEAGSRVLIVFTMSEEDDTLRQRLVQPFKTSFRFR